jgi:hypothetical protein
MSSTGTGCLRNDAPLAVAYDDWLCYARLAMEANHQGVCSYLEFAANDSLDSLRQDAKALKRILAEAARCHSPEVSKTKGK